MTEYRKAKGELRSMMGQLQESRRELERTKELVRGFIRGERKIQSGWPRFLGSLLCFIASYAKPFTLSTFSLTPVSMKFPI